MNRDRIAVALALALAAGCASATPRPAEDVHATALAPRECAHLDATACCDAVAARLRAARNAMAEDEAIEQLALSCPDQRRALLAGYPPSTLAAPSPDQPWSAIPVEFKLSLAPDDRLLWAAVYLDGARPGPRIPPGPHRLQAVFHLVSPEGQLAVIDKQDSITIPPGVARLSVILGRSGGAEPFRAALVWVHGRHGGELATMGQIGEVVGGVVGGVRGPDGVPLPPRTRRPRRLAAPSFEPPRELRAAGARPARMSLCVDASGRITSLSHDNDPTTPHPRLLGAALDWLRRFAYDRSSWGSGITQVCEWYRVPFDDVRTAARPEPGLDTHRVDRDAR